MTAASEGSQEAAFIKIPSGEFKSFWLGSKKEVLTKQVGPLFVQDHQVTNANYLKFIQSHPEWKKSSVSPLFADSGYLAHFKNDQEIHPGHNLNAPVTSVSWFAAEAYCESISARLPYLEEWEYIAAASETIRDANRDPRFLERILNWYSQPRNDALPSVKSIYKNAYGLFDLHGLVWEWVADFNSNTMTGESREDTSLDRNLFCGGSSMNAANKEDYAAFMRFAFRGSLKGKSTVWNLGFRCVKDIEK